MSLLDIALDIKQNKYDKSELSIKYPAFQLKSFSDNFEEYQFISSKGQITVTFDNTGKYRNFNFTNNYQNY